MNPVPPGDVQLAQESIPVGEVDAILALTKVQTAIMQAKGPRRRGQHPKAHGCVDAVFTVLPDLPCELTVGVFAEPKPFRARVRFSNGKSDDDLKPDVHGMAIKLFDVSGPRAVAEDGKQEQDFIFIDSEAFFASDVQSLLDFMLASVAAEKAKSPAPIQEFATKSAHNAATVASAQQLLKGDVPSPLAIPYWSTVPYRCGSVAVKYAVKPHERNQAGAAQHTSPNYLREALVEHLTTEQRSAGFDFYVQIQTDATTMPIEDPTVPWTSPLIRVATLEIGPQQFDTDECNRVCEETSFSPWHALEAHRPLGGINRARRPVYEASSALRHTAGSSAP